MVKHIVMWKLHEQDKQENAIKAKQVLEQLNGKIPGLLTLEVGIELIGDSNSADIVLYSEFESEVALQAYMKHPEHEKVVAYIKSIRCDRFAIDYVI